jgi:beta-phosphoglucomutase family hydrolase
MLDLPDGIRACLFDLDGVLTPTALIHSEAWKEMFDAFLAEYQGAGFVPFDRGADYERYVDGRPRVDGTRTFLTSRGIRLPEGSPDDPPDRHTIEGLSKRKDAIFRRVVTRDGVKPYPGSVRYLQACVEAGLRRAVVTSSAHGANITQAAGIADLLEVRVDGVVAKAEGLRGKPAPDTFLHAARQLGVAPAQAAVFEDALAGVEAGRAGEFGCVVGIDRTGQAAALREHGAGVVVTDLSDLLDRS